jgi:CHAT domain-containing protein
MVAPDRMPLPDQPRLDWTLANYDLITAFYDADRVTVNGGPRCTLPRLRAGLPDVDVVLFATHAEAFDGQDADPLDSYIALAPSEGHSGRLVLSEIAELELSVELAVLGGCRTGDGVVSSDGVLGVSRTFLQRGASALLMALHEVPEIETFSLVHLVHEHWRRRGLGLARALCEAQRELLNEFPDQPHLWAGFVLVGAVEETEKT